MDIKLPREQKLEIVGSIQHYFETELAEKIGQLAAEFLLDFMVKELGPFIYNQAVKDAKGVLVQKMVSLDEDLSALEKALPLTKR